ncbi:hypothetical protein J2T48_006159 [Pseudomonas nitroreducens]|nr:hypothetical protein [Pseudomonas nitroreducens]
MPASANPLIGETKADTIAGMCRLLDAACILAEDEENAHPGLRQVLLEARRYSVILKEGEKSSTR